jgi:hypothetical protein
MALFSINQRARTHFEIDKHTGLEFLDVASVAFVAVEDILTR